MAIVAVSMFVIVCGVILEAMRQMGQDGAAEPVCCEHCGQILGEGADMALEDMEI